METQGNARPGLGRVWRVAPVLSTLRAEVDVRWPNRSTVSDGTIGDPDHQSRKSDHNPDPYGVVRAWDVTHDHVSGPPMDALAEWLIDFGRRGSQRLSAGSFVIWNGRIASHAGMWVWRTYRGRNPHLTYMHISAPVLPAFYSISRSWDLASADFARPGWRI